MVAVDGGARDGVWGVRFVRGVSGVVAAGMVVLALVVAGSAVLGDARGYPGPGMKMVGWHVGLAVVAMVGQVFADRRRGLAAFSGSVVVFVAAGYLLVTQWWN
ncbi:hypothetical protein [Nocardia macrotermitis]|uniref:Uncharacterized protein n=1 Tax=Nocardia macrotermitis TaxID=2585198 RepID=A0A7K0D2F1_9NOCA|nr:hypothetical protein [Nocardia macrotermitis]MQY19896.1 hypothetical protein [Nocardia macrotermitis]